MEKRRVSLAEIQEVPKESLILLAGPPGAGKSTFCHQVVLNSIAADKPIIFVTTEQNPSAILGRLREKGMGEPIPGALNFVDAFTKTVGLAAPERANTLDANCEDLNSISMAIDKLQQRIDRRNIILAFDSLTSPYLFNEKEVFRFIRLCLAKFAAEGNSVLVLMDEGCGKEEDLGAMMSIADGIIRMEIKKNSRTISVVKHPRLPRTKIETPMNWRPVLVPERFDSRAMRRAWETTPSPQAGQPLRTEVGDWVNVFWKQFVSWSGMLWDPKRFPTIAYDFDKEFHSKLTRATVPLAPWHMRLFMKLFMPKSFSEVKDMKKLMRFAKKMLKGRGGGILEYMEEASRKDEHYFRWHENISCWGFDNIGARLDFHGCGLLAGSLGPFEKQERDWNVVETKCIGMGSPYCEFKAVPGEIDDLKGFLEAIDSSVVQKVHDRLMDQLSAFLLHDKPLPERPRAGSEVFFEMMYFVTVPALFNERYRMALRMGGAWAGKKVGEHLMNAGMDEDEIIKRVIHFIEYCKVGKISLGETIKMKESCETFGLKAEEPSCFFTTGFLNGLFSSVKKQHVKEIRCIATGDPFCEWEIR